MLIALIHCVIVTENHSEVVPYTYIYANNIKLHIVRHIVYRGSYNELYEHYASIGEISA